MPSNLPQKFPGHTIYRDYEYVHMYRFPEDYEMPEEVTAQVRRGKTLLTGISPSCSISDQELTITFSDNALTDMYGMYEMYLFFDEVPKIGMPINVLIGYGDHDTSTTDVAIVGDQITIVEMTADFDLGDTADVISSEEPMSHEEFRLSFNNNKVVRIQNGFAVYDSTDTESEDDGETILIDDDNKRYRIMTVETFFEQVLNAFNIFNIVP